MVILPLISVSCGEGTKSGQCCSMLQPEQTKLGHDISNIIYGCWLFLPHLYSNVSACLVCVCRLHHTLMMCGETGLALEGRQLFRLMFLSCQILCVLSLSIWPSTVYNKLSAVLQLTGLSRAIYFILLQNYEVITSDFF